MKLKIQLVFFFLLGFSCFLKAQVDSEFWFAAPEVTYVHGDIPIYLRISTFDKAANVIVDIPANGGFVVTTILIAANSTRSIDLSNYLSLLENDVPNIAVNKGLHIISDQKISAYYEVASPNNSDIFILKGRNALGTSFYTPFQTNFENGNYAPVTSYSSIDIVATEDNTQILIKPSNDIVGHFANIEFQITLNKGQTYSARAIGFAGSQHLQGTRIKSNRPVTVTIKDDSATASHCHDLIGDQLTPVSIIGKDYIAVKGFLDASTQDRLYILAVKDQTKVYLDGGLSPSFTLNEGEQKALILTDNAKFIHSSEPVYVLHISGFGCEMGGAILPHIACTGSFDMSFTRTVNEYFGLVLLIQNGFQDKFILNGNSSAISASMFKVVDGSDNQWVSASIDLSSVVPTGTASRITNSASLFNMGVINGGAKTACKYGYFSDYSSLNIGSDRLVCEGDTLVLDAQRKDYSYLWSNGETTQTIKATKAGLYSVVVKKNQCELKDTMQLIVNPKPIVSLGKDTNICIGSTIQLKTSKKFESYLWQNSSVNEKIQTDTTGLFWLRVTDSNGCKNTDSIAINVREFPKLTLTDTLFCDAYLGPINAKLDQKGSVQWSNLSNKTVQILNPNSLNATLKVSSYGTYSMLLKAVSDYGCAVQDTMLVSFHQKPTANFKMDSAKCYQDNVKLVYVGNASNSALYNWSFDDCSILSGVQQGPINLALGANEKDKIFKLQVVEDGCKSDTAKQTLKVTPSFSMTSDTTKGCTPTNIHFFAVSKKNNVQYLWDFGDLTTSNSQNPTHQFLNPQKYDVSLLITAQNGCQNKYTKKEMITVFQIPTSKMNLDTTTCYSDSISLTYKGNASELARFNWKFNDLSVISGTGIGPFTLNIGLSKLLKLSLDVTENGCFSDTTNLKLKRLPHIKIASNKDSGCQPLMVELQEKNQEKNMIYSWDFSDIQDNKASKIKVQHLFKEYGFFDIKLKVKTQEGCEMSDTKQIQVFKKPIASFNFSPKVALLDNATINFENLSNSAISYSWNYGDSSKSNEKNPVYLYTSPGEFKVELLVFSENLCTDTIVQPVSIGAFYAPNAFAPTSNVEKNRLFAPVSTGMNLSYYSFMIYNRWGNIVFETTNTDEAWDGKIKNGNEAAAGAYVWTISYLDIKGNEHKYSGSVVLIR